MVNFTCNHCGESLQKPRVEKHYQSTACARNGIAVTCMDCFKDFKLEEYVAHIKCITEEERYSAKGSVHAAKKGELKQSTWVATVNSIIEQQINAKPSVKSLLEMISKHDNIPRKQSKFFNFITSMSGGRVNTKDITEVWGLLEAHKKAEQEAKTLEATKTEQDKDKSMKRKSDDTPNEDATEDSSSKKKKTEDDQENNDLLNGNSKKKDKKNKRKVEKNTEDAIESTEDATEDSSSTKKKTENHLENNDVLNGNSKKNKKNKRKAQETSEEKTENETEDSSSKKMKTVDNLENNDVVNGNSKKKNKKNKRKAQKISEENTEGASETPKKKKTSESDETVVANGVDKCKKNNEGVKKEVEENGAVNGTKGVANTEQVKTVEESVADSTEADENGRSGFSSFTWKDAIMEVVSKKTEGLTQDQLQKEVFWMYESIKGKIINKGQVMKTYNKKIKKIGNIKFENNMVSLIL